MPPKQKYKREEIVSAAVRLVRTAGMPALTARALGERLNCSVAPIFSEFENMEELKTEVVRAAKRIYDGYIEEGLKQPLPFKGAGLKYIEFAKNEPNFFRILFMSEYDLDLKNFMLLDKNNEKIVGALVSTWGIDRQTANELHMEIMIYTHGLAAMCATKSCDFTVEEISERLTFAFTAMLKLIKEKKND